MTNDEIDSFTSMFNEPPGAAQREAREARARKERRTQMSEKQLKRSGVRTSQINFRCSPEFKAKADAMKAHMAKVKGGREWSVADVLEAALDLLADTHGFKG